MTSYFPRFVCPKCACEQLLEVRHEVKNPVAAIKQPENEDWEEIIYGDIHDGSPGFKEYSCGECDNVIKDQRGEPLHALGELGYWLIEQAEARMATIKFTCPSCGGHTLDDNVEIDDEGYCDRIFCCHDCGEVVCDQDESTLRKILEWGQKCSGRPQQLSTGGPGQTGGESDLPE